MGPNENIKIVNAYKLKQYYFGYNKGNTIRRDKENASLFNNHGYAQFKRISYTSINESVILKNPDIFEPIV